MLVAEKMRSLGEPQAKTPSSQPPFIHSATTVPPPAPAPAPPSSSSGRHKTTRTSSHDSDSSGGTPIAETWTEAKFGDGGAVGGRAARVTGEGAVLPMIRIRPR